MVISNGETFQPPDQGEDWANQQFSVVLNYLSENQIPYAGNIYLTWLGAPYISVWKGKSVEGDGEDTLWIMHNRIATDHFVDRSITHPRQVLALFGHRWLAAEGEGETAAKAQTMREYGQMFLNVAQDEAIWDI